MDGELIMVLPLIMLALLLFLLLPVLGFTIAAFNFVMSPWVRWILIAALAFYLFKKLGVLKFLRGVVRLG